MVSMVLYDYSKESFLNSILYVAISVICVVCLTIIAVFAIRTYMKEGWSEHSVFLSIAVVVPLILIILKKLPSKKEKIRIEN